MNVKYCTHGTNRVVFIYMWPIVNYWCNLRFSQAQRRHCLHPHYVRFCVRTFISVQFVRTPTVSLKVESGYCSWYGHCASEWLSEKSRVDFSRGSSILSPSTVYLHFTHNVRDRFYWLPTLKFCRWKSEKSGAQCSSSVLSIRFLSGSYESYGTPTSSDEHCKGNIILFTSFGLFWISWRIYLHSQLHIESPSYNVVIRPLLQTHSLPVCYFHGFCLLLCVYFESRSVPVPNLLSWLTTSRHVFDSCDLSDNEIGLFSLADQFLENLTRYLWVTF